MFLCHAFDLLPEHRPVCCFRRARSAPLFASDNSISGAASLRRPTCESGLCHFRADRYFPLFARPRRLARANGPKSRHMRTASESLGGISAPKSRTVGLNSVCLRRLGRRLFLPGCVATAMVCRLCQIPWLQGVFPVFEAAGLRVGGATSEELSSFPIPGRVSACTQQGILCADAGNLEAPSREAMPAQLASPKLRSP